jgi:hypothetical protein
MTDDVKSNNENRAWVFQGEGATLPCAVFTDLNLAENWIAENSVSGLLTAYPLDQSLYDWVIEQEVWTPHEPDQKSPRFIQRFSSAYAEHYHYQNGERTA